MFVSWRNNLKEEKVQSILLQGCQVTHTIRKMPVLDMIIRALSSIWMQKLRYETFLQRSMSFACLGHCQRDHCLYKWTSTFGTQGIISTQELSELHMLVPKLPHKPSAPELHGAGCKAALRLPGSVKDLGRAKELSLAFVCFLLMLNLLGPQGCKKALLSPI